MMHPEIMILDEPAAALDPKHTAIVNQIIDQLTADGITVLMSTHDVDYALAWADEVVLVKDGRVLAHKSALEIFSDQALLLETNLKQPAALSLFESLCQKGILSPNLPAPRTLETLEAYIGQLSQKS